MKITKGIALFIFIVTLFQCSNTSIEKEKIKKINGVSFVAPPKEIGKKEIQLPKKIIMANYISIMPYSFIPENSTNLSYDSEWQWWGEKTKGTIKTIQVAKEIGYGVMLKPHVWKRHGEFTGEHNYKEEKQWVEFEESFSSYILHYAKIADSLDVPIFCIGTEWETFVLSRPSFWRGLIKAIRKIYSGKLTYAANWDEYEKVPFWKELDYIGIDGYFPLVNAKTPSIEQIKKGISPFKKHLSRFSDSIQRKILFTEFGFRSRNNTAFKPWESDKTGEVNAIGQVNGYEGFFQSFWKEDYIAGGFLWKWFSNHQEVGGEKHNGFTPQNKPAEKVIFRNYQQ